MAMRLGWAATVVGVVGVAAAGQLHVQHFGLKECRAQGSTVLVGKVTASGKQGKQQTVTLTVTRVFAGRDGEAAKVGSSVTRALYGGVEWTDPHKSPLDLRLRGGLPGVPAEGTLVAVVPSERTAFELQ